MKTWIQGLRIYILFTLLTGVFYPLIITLLGQGFFPYQSKGSLFTTNQSVIGSELIAQSFKDPKFFWPRPSAIEYNPLPSGGTNLGPISLDQKNKMEDRIKLGFLGESLFASASGLDPHISPENAKHQAPRIAAARGIQVEDVMTLINQLKEKRQLGFLGMERLNVLKLNLELEKGK